MPKLDHLTVIAPSLEDGVDHIRRCLDVDIAFGRKHPHMGTHNHLLRLGEAVYLEVIAIDDAAPPPQGPRWFGLDDRAFVRRSWDEGRRLRGWVASTLRIDEHLARHPSIYGLRREFEGSSSSYFFAIPADGSLPHDGVAPSLIDRRGKLPALPASAEMACRFMDFRIVHPQPDRVAALYRSLQVDGAPVVEGGPVFHYTARIQTPSGLKTLF